MTTTIATPLYVGVCATALVGAVLLQHARHEQSAAWLWAVWNAMAFYFAWEIVDALSFGAPGFPASRWLIAATCAAAFHSAAWRAHHGAPQPYSGMRR